MDVSAKQELPDFFLTYLAALTDDQNQQMYLLACNDPGTGIRDAIMDAVSARANDNYGEGTLP